MNKRIDLLDSLRGMAATIVFIHHLWVYESKAIILAFNQNIVKSLFFISNLNHIAVIFFFILSGFSISISLGSKSLIDASNWNSYFFKRFNRILPIYWLSMLFTLITGFFIFSYTLPNDFSLLNCVGNLFFLQTSKYVGKGWFSPYGGNGPLWSLAYEMFYYILFPYCWWINKKTNKVGLTIKFFLLLILNLLFAYINTIFFVPFFAFFSSFIIWISGFVLAKIYTFNKIIYKIPIICYSIFSIFFLCFLQQRIKSEAFHTIALAGLISSLFLITIYYQHKNFKFKIVDWIHNSINYLFRKIGIGSFTIYALHYPFLLLLHQSNVNLSLVLVLSILFFIGMYYFESMISKVQFSLFKINYALLSPEFIFTKLSI